MRRKRNELKIEAVHSESFLEGDIKRLARTIAKWIHSDAQKKEQAPGGMKDEKKEE